MPARAFIDSDRNCAADRQPGGIVVMPARAFIDSDVTPLFSHKPGGIRRNAREGIY